MSLIWRTEAGRLLRLEMGAFPGFLSAWIPSDSMARFGIVWGWRSVCHGFVLAIEWQEELWSSRSSWCYKIPVKIWVFILPRACEWHLKRLKKFLRNNRPVTRIRNKRVRITVIFSSSSKQNTAAFIANWSIQYNEHSAIKCNWIDVISSWWYLREVLPRAKAQAY